MIPTAARRLLSAFRGSSGPSRVTGPVGTSARARSLLTPERFQAELSELGLSGREFSVEDYAAALARRLGLRIKIAYFDESRDPKLARALSETGDVAFLRYSEENRTAVVMVPAGLPPFARAHAAFHELGHLAAGDLARDPARRLAFAAPPPKGKELREEIANLRAEYSLTAGALGLASPYAERMYDAL